jgi:hypothetical protein
LVPPTGIEESTIASATGVLFYADHIERAVSKASLT